MFSRRSLPSGFPLPSKFLSRFISSDISNIGKPTSPLRRSRNIGSAIGTSNPARLKLLASLAFSASNVTCPLLPLISTPKKVLRNAGPPLPLSLLILSTSFLTSSANCSRVEALITFFSSFFLVPVVYSKLISLTSSPSGVVRGASCCSSKESGSHISSSSSNCSFASLATFEVG